MPDKKVKALVEIRGVYDGWSYILYEDGSMKNRWDPVQDPRRYSLTQEVINQQMKDNNDTSK